MSLAIVSLAIGRRETKGRRGSTITVDFIMIHNYGMSRDSHNLVHRLPDTERHHNLCYLIQSATTSRRCSKRSDLQHVATIQGASTLYHSASRGCIFGHELGHREVRSAISTRYIPSIRLRRCEHIPDRDRRNEYLNSKPGRIHDAEESAEARQGGSVRG